MRVPLSARMVGVLPTVALLAGVLLAGGCAGDGDDGSAALPDPLVAVLEAASESSWRTTGVDVVEVWTCRVPADSTAATYGGLPLRFDLQPAGLVEILAEHVTPYFDRLSHGRYRPQFVEGGEVVLSAAQGPTECIDVATAASNPSARAVLAIADAEHAPGVSGGLGRPGEPCVVTACPASVTGRAAYVAGNDFNPALSASPAMDLVEHELGHALGWAHSGVDDSGAYLSALDVMSNSAAARAADPTCTDAPDTLAINRLLAGWLQIDTIWAAGFDGGSVTLAPSTANPATGPAARRLAVVPVNDSVFLTVEVLSAVGLNAHLPTDGLAVHRVTVADGGVATIAPLHGNAPYTQLLETGSLTVDGWRITVDGSSGEGESARWSVSIVPNLTS